LIQTIGRAARNLNGTAILYADAVTESMRKAIDETNRRRAKQMAFNREHGIEPRGVKKEVRELIDGVFDSAASRSAAKAEGAAVDYETMSEKQLGREIKRLEKQMFEHAKNLEFEKAARARDQLALLRQQAFGASGTSPVVPRVTEKAA
jgi:excinuclease ABC subunit B